MTAETLLLELLIQHRVRPALAPDGRVLLRGPAPPPPEALERLRAIGEEVRTYLELVAIRLPSFVDQAKVPGPWPLFSLIGCTSRPGTCISCGSVLPEDSWGRCSPCRFAARLALEEVRFV